jgi:hypothetical protein
MPRALNQCGHRGLCIGSDVGERFRNPVTNIHFLVVCPGEKKNRAGSPGSLSADSGWLEESAKRFVVGQLCLRAAKNFRRMRTPVPQGIARCMPDAR